MPCWIRTNHLLLRRQLLYPGELRAHCHHQFPDDTCWILHERKILFKRVVKIRGRAGSASCCTVFSLVDFNHFKQLLCRLYGKTLRRG